MRVCCILKSSHLNQQTLPQNLRCFSRLILWSGPILEHFTPYHHFVYVHEKWIFFFSHCLYIVWIFPVICVPSSGFYFWKATRVSRSWKPCLINDIYFICMSKYLQNHNNIREYQSNRKPPIPRRTRIIKSETM